MGPDTRRGVPNGVTVDGGASAKAAQQSLVFTCRCLLSHHSTFSSSFTSLADALSRLDAAGKEGEKGVKLLAGDGDVPRRLQELAWTTVRGDGALPWIDGSFKLRPNKGHLRLVTQGEVPAVPVSGRLAGTLKKGVCVDGILATTPAGLQLHGHWNKHNEDVDAPAPTKADWKCGCVLAGAEPRGVGLSVPVA